MKTQLWFFFLVLALASGCKKDTQYSVTGNVRHKYTDAPLEGICVALFYDCGEPQNCARSLIAWDYTDADGYFNIRADHGRYGNVLQNIIVTPFDTASNMFRSMVVLQAYPTEFRYSCYSLLLPPSGCIQMHVSDSVWNVISADSIVIETPYVMSLLIKDADEYNTQAFYVEPSQISRFKWHYIKNGVAGPQVVRDIYVPNYYKNFDVYPAIESPLRYEIAF